MNGKVTTANQNSKVCSQVQLYIQKSCFLKYPQLEIVMGGKFHS